MSEPDLSGIFDDPKGVETPGYKLDAGKARFDLLPPDALLDVAKVFTFGAKKYNERNWEKGMDWGRVYGAAQRHQNAFWGGEAMDAESGVYHTTNAAFGMLVLTAYQMRGVGVDTRFLAPRSATPLEHVEPVMYMDLDVDCVKLTRDDFNELLLAAGRSGVRE